MSRVRNFFLREGAECLDVLRSEVERESGPMDVAAMYRALRRFRGSAQMARFGSLAGTALAWEQRLRPYEEQAASERRGPDEGRPGPEGSELRREVRAVLRSLEEGMEAVREGRVEEDPRMEAGMVEEGGRGMDEETVVVPIETLEYRGEAALERALALREPLRAAMDSNEPAEPILDELYDLIRSAVQ